MRRIVFLDVDGVLNNRSSFGPGKPSGKRCLEPSCVKILNRICSEAGAVIVVSSTWRMDPDIKDILLTAGVEARVIGITPHLGSQPRGAEISQWLMKHPPCAFVILDDDADMGLLMPFLVQTTFENGLTDEHARRAIKILTENIPALESMEAR